MLVGEQRGAPLMGHTSRAAYPSWEARRISAAASCASPRPHPLPQRDVRVPGDVDGDGDGLDDRGAGGRSPRRYPERDENHVLPADSDEVDVQVGDGHNRQATEDLRPRGLPGTDELPPCSSRNRPATSAARSVVPWRAHTQPWRRRGAAACRAAPGRIAARGRYAPALLYGRPFIESDLTRFVISRLSRRRTLLFPCITCG